eukprot:129816-Prymnesium_polylepis.2
MALIWIAGLNAWKAKYTETRKGGVSRASRCVNKKPRSGFGRVHAYILAGGGGGLSQRDPRPHSHGPCRHRLCVLLRGTPLASFARSVNTQARHPEHAEPRTPHGAPSPTWLSRRRTDSNPLTVVSRAEMMMS